MREKHIKIEHRNVVSVLLPFFNVIYELVVRDSIDPR
jgi:hypothetical protein